MPLSDAVGAEIGAMLTEVHQDHAVDIVTDAMVEGVRSEGGRTECGSTASLPAPASARERYLLPHLKLADEAISNGPP